MNSLKFDGKTSRTDATFKKKFNVSQATTTQYKQQAEQIRYFYNSITKELIKANIRDSLNFYKGIIKNWGVGRLTNKEIIEGGITVLKDKFVISDELNYLYDIKEDVNLTIELTYIIFYSDTPVHRYRSPQYNGKINDLKQYIRDYSYNYLRLYPIYSENYILTNWEFMNYDDWDGVDRDLLILYTIKDNNQGLTYYLDPTTQRLRENKFYNIVNICNELIEIEPSEENCVKAYLKKYTDIIEKKINIMGNNEGITPDEIKNFCQRYNIKCILYDIEGNIILSNYPQKDSKRKSIIGICYNNHFYGVKNKYLLNKRIPDKAIIKNNEEIKNIFDDSLNNFVIPGNIKLNNKNEISSFNIDDTTYINNNDYNICLEILNLLGLKDKISPYTTLLNICSVIESAYILENINSFLPINIIKPAYNYYNTDINHEKEINKYITIDHNKFYSNCLYELEYLIMVDWRQQNIIKYTKETQPTIINPRNLYIVEPLISSLLLPNVNIYSGEHILYCFKEGFEYIILEEIQTETKENYYKKMIEDLYNKINHTEAKNIINIMIGKMQMSASIESKQKIIKVANLDERRTDKSNKYILYRDEIYLKYEEKEKVKHLYNKKPIAIQIKDLSAVKLYEKIKSLKLKENELISIETDSITFINSGQYEKIKSSLSSDNWRGWKRIYKDIEYFKKHQTYINEETKTDLTLNDLEYFKNKNNNILFDCYAGAGKSHRIKNEIIPMIKDDYIILTPKHTVNKAYIKLGLNSKVIQTFIYSNEIPKEKYIIVDEIGLFDRRANDILYKCYLSNKIIYSFGDYKQLLPIFESSHFNSEQYLKMLYGQIYNINTNYRNNYSKEYYDKLINNEIDLIKEIKKHRVKDYTKAEIIICITNKEIDEYNKLMMDYLNIKFDELNSKIICISNDLRNKGIYNNFDYKILNIEIIDDNIIYKIDDNLFITDKELNKYFKPNYAMTLFKAQGEEYESYYIPNSSLKYINSRQAYTIISRLKEKLNKYNINNNNKINKNITIKYE